MTSFDNYDNYFNYVNSDINLVNSDHSLINTIQKTEIYISPNINSTRISLELEKCFTSNSINSISQIQNEISS